MAAKRIKMFEGRKNGEEPVYGAMDRISTLPDSIIHDILSFIPTIDAVRMSVLSKRWRHMWCSVPALNLSYIPSDGREQKYFNRFVDNCLKLRGILGMHYIVGSSITRFQLEILYYNGGNRVDKWLNSVAKNKLEELDLCITPMYHQKGYFYSLPEAILNIAQSFTILKLDGLKIDAPFQVSLPSLKLLSLKNINGRFNDHSLEDLLANCPSLERLVLKICPNLSTPQVSSPSLKSFEVQLVESRQQIKIEALNLRSLHIRATKCEISHDVRMNLKSLSLFEVRFDAGWLEDLGLTLESLTIRECEGWEDINIKGQHLKNLVICKAYYQEVANIIVDAPNLVSFTYKDCGIRSFDISLSTPNLLVCNVTIAGNINCDTDWYVNLLCLLSKFSCSKSMCLHVYSGEALIFPKHLRSICPSPLPTLERLKVKTFKPLLMSCDLIRDALFWLSPSLKSFDIEQQLNGFYYTAE